VLECREALGEYFMFRNLFKRRKRFDDAAKMEFATNLAEMLKLQLLVTGKATIEDQWGRPKRKAIGYVYGFVDAALRTVGQDMADMEIGVPVTFQVIRRLWPDRAIEYMDFLAKNVRTDALINIGLMQGGQQYLDYRKPDRPGVPMGLARFIIEGD
jgi:hypothetical protein